MKTEVARRLAESGCRWKSHASRQTLLRWLVCGWITCAASLGDAATYVIRTDTTPLSNDAFQAIGALQGVNTPGYVFFSPTNLGNINGAPLRFGGYSSSGGADVLIDTAVFA